MGKNIPENKATRVQAADEEQFRVETRYFSGIGPRPMGAFPRFNGGFGAELRAAPRERALEAKGLTPCSGGKKARTERGVNFGDMIGKELQSLYDDVVAQPVPDRFLNLLNQLEKNVVSSGASKNAPGERE